VDWSSALPPLSQAGEAANFPNNENLPPVVRDRLNLLSQAATEPEETDDSLSSGQQPRSLSQPPPPLPPPRKKVGKAVAQSLVSVLGDRY